MPTNAQTFIGLDVGEKRIGVARADTVVRLAAPIATIEVDGTELDHISRLVMDASAETLVVGFPRNMKGEETAQTQAVMRFAERLKVLNLRIVFQDESLTSVMAEERLKAHKKQYTKGDIDAYAAAIILNDYLEMHHAAA